MDQISFNDMLLFSKELDSYPYKYKLFFVEAPSLRKDKPIIHRFVVSSRKKFDSFALGRIYSLTAKGLTITAFTAEDTYNLTEFDYLKLVDTRDLCFMDAQTAETIGLNDGSYDPHDYYYTYSVYKSLLEYRGSPSHRFAYISLKLAMYFLCFIVPVVLYFMFVYATSSFIGADATRPGQSLAVPVSAMGTLPFVIWLMSTIYTFSELLMLNTEYLRTDILRGYALRWAGIRKNCFMENSQRQRIAKQGLISFAIMAVCMLISFILL